MASLDGLCTKGLRVLCDGPLNGGLTCKPQTVKHRSPGLLCLDLWRLLGDLGCGSYFSHLLESD